MPRKVSNSLHRDGSAKIELRGGKEGRRRGGGGGVANSVDRLDDSAPTTTTTFSSSISLHLSSHIPYIHIRFYKKDPM